MRHDLLSDLDVQPVLLRLGPGRQRTRLAGRRLEPDAVVPDVERHLVAHVREREDHPARARVAGHIGEGLLGGAE